MRRERSGVEWREERGWTGGSGAEGRRAKRTGESPAGRQEAGHSHVLAAQRTTRTRRSRSVSALQSPCTWSTWYSLLYELTPRCLTHHAQRSAPPPPAKNQSMMNNSLSSMSRQSTTSSHSYPSPNLPTPALPDHSSSPCCVAAASLVLTLHTLMVSHQPISSSVEDSQRR